MYAVVKEGGRQLRVAEGALVKVDKKSLEPGETFTFASVLLVHDENGVKIGEPALKNVSVTGRVERHERGKKCIVYKFKRRKNYRRKQGHRQGSTLVKIQKIEVK